MATRDDIINELLKKMFEFSGNWPPYENLRENKNEWHSLYSMNKEAKARWLSWGSSYLQKQLGISSSRAQMEMQMLDQMWGLKTY